MGIKEANIWRSHFFKKVILLFSSSQHVQPCLYVDEEGTLSLQELPLSTGFCAYEKGKMAWSNTHSVKERVEGLDEPVLVISGRSYKPLDPYKRIKDSEATRHTSLAPLFKSKWAEAKAHLEDMVKQSAISSLLWTCLYMSGILVALALIVAFFRGGK